MFHVIRWTVWDSRNICVFIGAVVCISNFTGTAIYNCNWWRWWHSQQRTESACYLHHKTVNSLAFVYESITWKLAAGPPPPLYRKADPLSLFPSSQCRIWHNTLQHPPSRLSTSFGISATMLSWLQSYLTNRTLSVRIGRDCSSSVICTTGVSHGSVLGPPTFHGIYFSYHWHRLPHRIDQQQYAKDILLGTCQRAHSCTNLITINTAGCLIPLADITPLSKSDKNCSNTNMVTYNNCLWWKFWNSVACCFSE